MPMLTLLPAVVAGLADVAPSVPEIPAGSSPLSSIISVTLGGIAAIILAAGGFIGVWRRRNPQGEADAVTTASPSEPVDPEDRPARLRERHTRSETRLDAAERRLDELEEQMMIRRAADVALESEHAPSRRRRTT